MNNQAESMYITLLMSEIADKYGMDITTIAYFSVAASLCEDDQVAILRFKAMAKEVKAILERTFPAAPASRKGVDNGSSQSKT